MGHPLEPSEHYRLHFSRARFIEQMDEHFVRLCTLLAQKHSWEHRNAASFFLPQLRLFPNLAGQTEKTVKNYFTEVTSLFSFYTLSGEAATVGDNAIRLADTQDVVDFFVNHLLRFQFPNGHLKRNFVLDQVGRGIRFKPGNYFVRLLLEGQRLVGPSKAFGISPYEATWFGTNDLLALRGERSPEENAARILHARGKTRLNPPEDLEAYGLPAGIRTTPADFNRYARDILSWLEFARVVVTGPDRLRYLRSSEAIPLLAADTQFFDGFSDLSVVDTSHDEFRDVAEEWLKYVTKYYDVEVAERNGLEISDAIPTIPDLTDSELDQVLASVKVDTAAIGNQGEAIALAHERNRLRACGRPDLARKVKKLPDHLGVGYDLESFECDGQSRCIEVKTTQSRHRLQFQSFHLTTNEWRKAETLRTAYHVYRVSLSDEIGVRLQTVTDPVGLYKSDRIRMTPRDGADVSYTDEVAVVVELMLSDT